MGFNFISSGQGHDLHSVLTLKVVNTAREKKKNILESLFKPTHDN